MRSPNRPTAADLSQLIQPDCGSAHRADVLDRALADPVALAELRLLLALESDADTLARSAARPAPATRGWRFAVPAAGALAVAALLFTMGPRHGQDLPELTLETVAGTGTELAMVDTRSDVLMGGSFEAPDRFSGGFEQ